MEPVDWYRYRKSEGYAKMGAPSREKRKIARESKQMAGREMKYKGIWNKSMSMSEMKHGEGAGSAMSSQLTIFRTDPSPETWNAFLKMAAEFEKFWGPIYADMKDAEASALAGNQPPGNQQTKPNKGK